MRLFPPRDCSPRAPGGEGGCAQRCLMRATLPRGGGGRRADSCRMADLMGMMRRPLFMSRGRNGNMGFPVGDVCVRVSLYQIKGGEESPGRPEKKCVVWRALCVGCGVVNPYCADTLVKRLSVNRFTDRRDVRLRNRPRRVSRISPNSDRELARVRRPPRPHTYLSGCILPMYLLGWFFYLRVAYGMLPDAIVVRFWKF